MPSWNMFSEEVKEERRKVRAYGVDKIQDRVCESDSYKGQALRQLAMRLELEEKVEDLHREIGRLVDRVEELELQLDLRRIPHA